MLSYRPGKRQMSSSTRSAWKPKRKSVHNSLWTTRRLSGPNTSKVSKVESETCMLPARTCARGMDCVSREKELGFLARCTKSSWAKFMKDTCASTNADRSTSVSVVGWPGHQTMSIAAVCTSNNSYHSEKSRYCLPNSLSDSLLTFSLPGTTTQSTERSVTSPASLQRGWSAR